MLPSASAKGSSAQQQSEILLHALCQNIDATSGSRGTAKPVWSAPNLPAIWALSWLVQQVQCIFCVVNAVAALTLGSLVTTPMFGTDASCCALAFMILTRAALSSEIYSAMHDSQSLTEVDASAMDQRDIAVANFSPTLEVSQLGGQHLQVVDMLFHQNKWQNPECDTDILPN